jgi:hypothetical protein
VDAEIVAGLYDDFFALITPTIKAVSLQQPAHWTRHRHWMKKDLQNLAASLPSFTVCGSLSLRGRQLGDQGVAILSQVLPRLERLVELNLASCGFGDLGLERLVWILEEMPRLECLCLHGCKFSEPGLQKLRKLLDSTPPALPALRTLTLPEELEHTVEGQALDTLLQQQEERSTDLLVTLRGTSGYIDAEFENIGDQEVRSVSKLVAEDTDEAVSQDEVGQLLRASAETLKISRLTGGGPIESWNSKHPSDKQVRVGDVVAAVNGVTGNIDKMLAELAKSKIELLIKERVRPTTNVETRMQISEVGEWLQKNHSDKARTFQKEMSVLLEKCKVVQWM